MAVNITTPIIEYFIDSELKNLYQRKSAVDRLIRSLEDYERLSHRLPERAVPRLATLTSTA
jgi:hypothetical protein